MPETWVYTNARGASVTLAQEAPITLASGARLIVQEQEGYGAPPANVYTYHVPLLPGDVFVKARHGARTIALRGVLVAGSWAQLKAAQRDLAELLDPALGEGTLTVTRADGAQRQIRAVVQAGLGALAAVSDRFTQRFAFTFLAAQPYWQATSDVTVTFQGVGTGLAFPATFPVTFTTAQPAIGARSTVTNPGTAPAAPVVTLTGPMQRPAILHLEAGKRFALLGDVPPGGELTIDMRPDTSGWRLTAYGTTYHEYPPVDPASQMFELVPGDNALIIANDAPGAGGTATVTFRCGFSRG
jgi:hypothetical protein